MLRAGVDIGGTFTDLCVVDRDRVVAVGKTLTTPDDPSRAVETVLSETLGGLGATFSDLRLVVHGTTLVTSAMGVLALLLGTALVVDILRSRS